MSTQYNQLIELGQDKKMVAATEVGAAPLPDQLQAYEAHWLWFAVWGDSFINNADWNSPANLNTVSFPVSRRERRHETDGDACQIFNSDYVLTLDEIQGWKGA
jgi:mannan endo-1,4-beta-mannosidase